MAILVACEESQTVTKEFRKLGAEAFSCDIEPCSGGHEEWHLEMDVIEALQDKWDAVIAFPPCTHLASSGSRHFKEKIADGRQQQGIDFFMFFANLEIERVCIENPIGIMSTKYRKPNQIIQPWMFGHMETKATCLWLKGLPRLTETFNVKEEMEMLDKKERNRVHYMSPGPDRAKMRSKTYDGIAKAMASQWASVIYS